MNAEQIRALTKVQRAIAEANECGALGEWIGSLYVSDDCALSQAVEALDTILEDEAAFNPLPSVNNTVELTCADGKEIYVVAGNLDGHETVVLLIAAEGSEAAESAFKATLRVQNGELERPVYIDSCQNVGQACILDAQSAEDELIEYRRNQESSLRMD